ncbi:alpha/beta hydrolase [Trueperella pyogenes]|uniref:alpha/beta fold hydrolase n=1 Tax=Trueperella pyogenes TaxID=1661 RepID=UPI003132B8C3
MIAYRRTGPVSDLPLVLLHALPLDSTMWDAVRSELTDIDILTFDAPGFGRTELSAQFTAGEPNTSTFVAAIKTRLDELGITRIALGGLSMGGSVAADFTATHPDLVAGLALMDTNITSDDADRKAFRRNVAAHADEGRGYEMVKDWTTTMVGPDAPQAIRDSLDARLHALPNEGLAWIQRAMANRVDRSDAVALVDGPVYFIRGTEDPTASLEGYMRLALRTAQPHIREIEGVGHFAADEKPAELAKILRDFYARVGR